MGLVGLAASSALSCTLGCVAVRGVAPITTRCGAHTHTPRFVSAVRVPPCGPQELTRVAKEDRLKGYEIIKAVHLESVQFSVEEDLLTPSFKLRRPQLQVGVRACVLGVCSGGAWRDTCAQATLHRPAAALDD